MRYIRIENVKDPTDFNVYTINDSTFKEEIQYLKDLSNVLDFKIKITEISAEQYKFSLDTMARPMV